MRRNILLLSAGRRVDLLDEFKSAAKDLGLCASVMAADMNPALSAACAVADDAYALPHARSPAYPNALGQLCRNADIGLMIPTIDTELPVLSGMRNALCAEGTEVVISDKALIGFCQDKRLTSELFLALGLDTPGIYEADRVSFPCFSKPYDGSSSLGALRLDSPDDLSPAMAAEDNRMFMELVPDSFVEFTIDLYFDRWSYLKAAIPRERIETRAGEISKGITRRGWLYELLCDRLNSIEGARGCITLQLFASMETKEIRAIEINPRFGGGYPLAFEAGANFPIWLMREYLLGENLEFFDDWSENIMMLRYDSKVIRREA